MRELEYKAKWNGVEQTFKVVSPGIEEEREAQRVYNTTFNEAIKSEAILRAKLEDVMRRQGLWDDKKQAELVLLEKEIQDLEYRLKAKGIKLTDARTFAIKLTELREKRREILLVKSQLASLTCEGQSENARYNSLVASCIRYPDGTRVFANLDEFIRNIGEDVAYEGAQKFSQIYYQYSFEDADLPEYKFLKKYKFVDEKLRLVDKQGRLIDKDGHLIDEFGYRINENGEYLDANGRPLTKEGDWKTDESYFLDDDGNPILDEEVKAEVEDSSGTTQESEELVENMS